MEKKQATILVSTVSTVIAGVLIIGGLVFAGLVARVAGEIVMFGFNLFGWG